MIASNSKRRTCSIVALLGLSLCAVKVVGDSYTWTNEAQDNKWAEECNWLKPGCDPCYGCDYPYDSADDATFQMLSVVSLAGSSPAINNLTIHNSDVSFVGGTGGGGTCTSVVDVSANVILISASNGNSAQLRGGTCTFTSTFD